VRGKELLAALFPIFTALLVWPLLTVANRPVLVAGVPALVLYLFCVWAAIVGLLAWAGRRARREDGP
jgi:membrane protein implicated in regulation of membrane protease activity